MAGASGTTSQVEDAVPLPPPPPAQIKVIVMWDGRSRVPYPQDMLLPPGSVVTLPPGSLEGYDGPDPDHQDQLLDDILGWATTGPTLVVPWRGLPGSTIQLLRKIGRVIGRDQLVSLPPAPTPLTALSVGWRTAMLAALQPIGLREARALAMLLAAETQSLAAMPRPHRSALVELHGLDVARSLRGGNKRIRFGERTVLSGLTHGSPLLDAAPRVGPVPAEGPRLVFVVRVDGHDRRSRVELGLTTADTVIEMAPGSLDREAWGQRGYTEVVASPRAVDHLLPSATGWQLCRGCEQLKVAGRHVVCDRCSLQQLM